jgi:hypothetical protein
MITDIYNIEKPVLPRELAEMTNKLELLEKIYHEEFQTRLNEHFEKSKTPLQKRILLSQIIACSDGFFIIREAKKHNINGIATIPYLGNTIEARKEFGLNRLEHVKLINKFKFYSLEYLKYEQIDFYDAEAEAKKDVDQIIHNGTLQDDGYIREVSDVIELGKNKNFEKGQLIFRGEVNDEWNLLPKLLRGAYESPDFLDMVLLETVLLGYKGPYSDTYDPIEHLTNFQHFGIPTRLLDWTSDLLIALFFACYDEHDTHNDKDGIIYAIEKSQYSTLNVNSSENDVFRSPINPKTVELFKKRLDIETIHIFEPVIKNPRLRTQDGCFMLFSFFPLSHDEKGFVSLRKFVKAKNKLIKQENEINNTSHPEVYILSKKVDKKFKKSILNELDEKWGISKKTIFVEVSHIKEVESHYLRLYERALKKEFEIKNLGKTNNF